MMSARQVQHSIPNNEYFVHILFQRWPLLADWPPRWKRQLASSLVRHSHSYGSTVVRQGEAADHIVFIIRLELNPHNAELIVYPSWSLKGLFQFEIIINGLVVFLLYTDCIFIVFYCIQIVFLLHTDCIFIVYRLYFCCIFYYIQIFFFYTVVKCV